MFSHSSALLLFLSAAALPAMGDAAAEQNSLQLMQAAQAAFARHDVAAAASLSNLAMLRFRADMYCFRSDKHEQAQDDFGYAQAALDDALRPATLGDPAVLDRVVADAEAWVPALTPSYDPGWQSTSRCTDYPDAIKAIKAQMLPIMQRGATLLRVPEYRQAYGVFMDVMQDYSAPPPDDAYSPQRIAALGAAIHTMQDVETRQGLPYFGQMAAAAPLKPVPLRILAGGQSAQPIAYRSGKDSMSGKGGIQVVGDKAAFAALWHAVYGDAGPAIPVVDFGKQLVVAVLAQAPMPGRMFISRIELETRATPTPSMVVYMRVPVRQAGCGPRPGDIYPYSIALIDRPAGTVTPGADLQNFPAPGCPGS